MKQYEIILDKKLSKSILDSLPFTIYDRSKSDTGFIIELEDDAELYGFLRAVRDYGLSIYKLELLD